MSWTRKLPKALSISSGPDVIMDGPGGSTGHSDHYGSEGSMALGRQHYLRRLTRPWASAGPSVVTETMDINSDIGSCRAVDPDMLLAAVPAWMCPPTSAYSSLPFTSSVLPRSIAHGRFCFSISPISLLIFALHNGTDLFSDARHWAGL